MATPQASSRLELLQARFQQKQLQEKEQKLLQLYDQQQQRAYQVVQRGSAGSNGSNHGSSINQHTVTKTTTTSHTTSTSHGGKVRQMFDERRQTTVKGIDRSYPLEPLENKPRKQTNENVAQKNGNLTVNRQSVTVKRVARADVNSNLNGGKPIVSYHEEITRDSYGPAGRPRSDDDEFGNENHINQYANGNETHIGEVLDEDTIERNRMMAKLHLMQYDETLKHRVKNDLESEEFPADYMVDVPDKLPKRTVTKKLSQAEARLERFKNANAKRSNSVTKNPSTVLKKRSDPIFPAKSTSSGDRDKTRTRQIFDRGSTRGNTESNVVSPENVDDGSLSSNEKSTKRKDEDNTVYYKEGEKLMSSEIHKELRTSEQSPKLVRKQSEKSIEMHSTNAKYREKSPRSSKNIPRRNDDSKTGRKSADQLLLKNRAKRNENPKYFCEESEKSATTYAIDSKTREKLSPDFSTSIQRRSQSPDVKQNLSSKLSKNIEKRSASPKYFCKESETSATTYAIDSKTREKLSPDFSTSIQRRSQSPDVKQNLSSKLSKNIEKRSASPKYFCKESETSATTYAIDSKTREKLSPDFSTNIKQRSESPDVKQNLSSKLSKNIEKRSASPKYFCKESETSATTYAIDSKTREKLSPDFSTNIKQRSKSPDVKQNLSSKLSKNIEKRSASPKYFCKESETSATTYAIDSKTREKLSPDFSTSIQRRSQSPDVKQNLSSKLSKNIEKRSASPKYFCKESETSATTYAIDSKTREKLSPDFSTNIKQRSKSPDVKQNLSSKLSKNIEKRSASPKYFCKESETSATTYAIDSKTREKLSPDFSTSIQRRSESPDVKQNLSPQSSKSIEKRSASPKYFCKESENIMKRSESPKLYRKASEKPATTVATDSKSAKQLASKSQMKDKQRSESPKYFSEETEKSATTYSIGSRSRSATPDLVRIDPVHSENVSQRNYRKPESEVNKKSTSNKMPNVFERLTRARSASPKSVHTAASKRIKSTKTPDSTKKVPRKRNESPEITKSKSPSFARQHDGRSSTSPQFFGSDSETSATIMLVTPETILKKRPESISHRSKTYKTDNTVTGLKRTMSEEIVDASSKQSIRNSVSRFFTEQCEKASRNLQTNKGNNVRSEVTDKNRHWSRDSSPLSLKDLRTTGPRFSEKPISSIDSVRDWSPKSRRNSINPSPEPSGNKIVPTGTENSSMHRSKQPIVKKSRSPENLKSANKTTDRVHANVLRSTRLIREAINRNNRTYVDDVDKRDSKGQRRTCRVDENDAGISDEKCRKVDERSRTPSCKLFESPATECSPKSSTSVEVDAEIQEITMPDQYIEHQPREVRSRSRDKTPDCGRSSTERLFTYSVRKPARKRGSLFESNVFELSRKDQGKTDRRETSGRKERVSSECTVKNRSPSTDSLTFRGSKCSAEEKQQAKTETDDFKIDRKKVHDDIKGTKRNWSSSPSPTSDLTFRDSKSSIKENKEIRRGSRTDLECRKRESDNIRRTQRDWSNSPSPTRDLTFGYKHPSKESEEVIQKTETRSSPEKKVPGEYQREKYDNLKCKKRDYMHSHRMNNVTFRVYKRSFEENDGVDRKIRTVVSSSPERIILDEYNKEKYDDFRHTQEHLSSSPSPTDSSAFRRPESNKNTKRNSETKVEISRSQRKSVSDKRNEGKSDNFERRQRSWSSSPSPTSNLTVRGSKRVTKSITKKDKANIQGREQRTNDSRKTEGTKCTNRSKSSVRKMSEPSANRRSEIREKSSSTRKRTSSKSPEVKESEILRSMELVRRVIKGGASKQEETIKTAISNETVENKDTDVKKSDSTGTMKIETRKSSSTIVYLNDETSSSHYERTDSVESALRRFDSIGTVSVQSITEKRQTAEESTNDSKAISLKALDRIDANPPQGITNVPSLRSTTVVSEETNENGSETRCRRKYARMRDSIEIARIVMGSKTPGCKRKLFPDDGEAENGSSRSRRGSITAKIGDDVLEKSDSKMGSRGLEKKSIVTGDKSGNEDDEMSTGVTLHLSVKQLRSIDDIRKSIDSVETKGTSSGSAIANEPLKRSDATRSGRLSSRRTDVDGSKKVTILPKRSENITAKKHALGDRERSSIKCAIRFSRVTKSPSPDSTKTTESSGRAKRNVLASPSKSPDTVTAARRPSTELKAQEARSTKRPTLMKGAEPIGNRKTATTTSTRKSTDVVDGAILENGVHLRDQTAETKYDNDSSATKKNDAFVIDFDEQPPKENDAPVPRKSLLRKQSTDKQIPSTPAGRPPSSVSSISSGSSMQCQVSGSRSKMASKAKTPSGTAYRGSPSSKSGGSAVVADSLVPCKICGRRFAQDRVTLHEQICTKTAQKKRKQFDAMLYRVRGTELEPFVKKGLCKKQPEKLKKTEPKSNWRRKHEDFINAIRSAKQVQAHLAAGGKLSDLPPPPASDTSDYIQCPHCGRKFNQSAAERHIPKCENMLHNKPVHSRAPKPKR